MENDIKTILHKLEGLDSRFATLEQRVDQGFKEMETGFKDTGESITGVMVMASKRFDAVEQRLDRIEKSYGYRLETLERDVADLKT
jgi:hypothetical protein